MHRRARGRGFAPSWCDVPAAGGRPAGFEGRISHQEDGGVEEEGPPEVGGAERGGPEAGAEAPASDAEDAELGVIKAARSNVSDGLGL